MSLGLFMSARDDVKSRRGTIKTRPYDTHFGISQSVRRGQTNFESSHTLPRPSLGSLLASTTGRPEPALGPIAFSVAAQFTSFPSLAAFTASIAGFIVLSYSSSLAIALLAMAT